MSTEDEAKVAIEKMNKAKVGDRELTVNEARPRPERTGAAVVGAVVLAAVGVDSARQRWWTWRQWRRRLWPQPLLILARSY